MIDFSKPLYVNGQRVYLIGPDYRDNKLTNIEFWQRQWDGKYGYVNVSPDKYSGFVGNQSQNSSFYKTTYGPEGSPHPTNALKGILSNNKDNNMLDLNKPLVVGGKDAKVIHTFSNGNLAVIVEGEDRVYTFEPTGNCITFSYGNLQLKNKVVETVRYINVYPGDKSKIGATASLWANRTTPPGKTGAIEDGGCQIKQTLIDGKVVKSEIVS